MPLKNLINWLTTSSIVDSNGGVYSWSNPNKSGYIYEEIMGYYIKLMVYLYLDQKNELFLGLAKKTADFLVQQMHPSGGFSRNNIRYTFDSAIVLSALISLSQTLKTRAYDKQIIKIAEFVRAAIETNTGAFDEQGKLENNAKWSLSYGCHLLKASIALFEAGAYLKNVRYKTILEINAQNLIAQTFSEGSFRINRQNPVVYTHAHCYATEGLLFLQDSGYDYKSYINQSGDWLAHNQNNDGSLYNWYYNPSSEKLKVCDATAQATRIWLLINRVKYKKNIDLAINFLINFFSPEGGIYYAPTIRDVNSWTGIFTVQDLSFNEKTGATPKWII